MKHWYIGIRHHEHRFEQESAPVTGDTCASCGKVVDLAHPGRCDCKVDVAKEQADAICPRCGFDMRDRHAQECDNA